MKNYILRIGFLLILIMLPKKSSAQDIHFSQFYESSILRNPSLVGIAAEDYKVGVCYKNQWNSVSKPYVTTLGTAEMRVAINNEANDYFSFGLLGYNDQSGSISLKTTAFYPSLNYNKSLNNKHNSYLSLGFVGGYLQRSFDLSKMTFDNQYQGGVVIVGAGSGEDLPNPKFHYWDLGTGISYNSGIGENNNTHYVLGLSAYHITTPKTAFIDNPQIVKLSVRWNAQLGFTTQLNEEWQLALNSNYMLQGKYQETIAGAIFRYGKLNDRNKAQIALSLGAMYRVKDAIIPLVKMDYKGATFAVSYDINISPLKVATHLRGGLECTVFYTGLWSNNADDKKHCPRF